MSRLDNIYDAGINIFIMEVTRKLETLYIYLYRRSFIGYSKKISKSKRKICT